MCRSALVVSAALALLVAVAAPADTLKYAKGGHSTGTLQELIFQVGEAQTIHSREGLASVQLAEEGNDTIVLQDGTKREGKLVSVRLKSSDGTVSVGRKELGSVELSVANPVEEEKADEKKPAEEAKEEAKEETKPATQLTDAQKEMLTKNLELKNTCLAKSAEMKKDELKAFGDKGRKEWDQVCGEVKKLTDSIAEKKRRRKDADRQWQNDRLRNPGVNINPPSHNDGLDRDQDALRQAENKQMAAARALKSEKSKVYANSTARERRINSVYDSIKKAVYGGTQVAEEQMTARYDAALQAKAADGKKGG